MKRELGLSDDVDVLAHVDSLSVAEREVALEIIYRHEHEGVLASSPIDGALEFVKQAQNLGYPCAIFTRNARTLAAESLKMHGFEIDFVIAREDGPAKPKPDGLLKIATTFDVAVAELLFVGDYIYDLQAALAAGALNALYLPKPADFDTTGVHFTFETYRQLADRIFPS